MQQPGTFPGILPRSAAGGAGGGRLRRAVRHLRTPWSLPKLVWKNLSYAVASRRPQFWNQRGRQQAMHERYEDALACYDRALAIRHDIPQVWANRSRALRNLDRLEEAEAGLREALRLAPDFANAHIELARVLDLLGRFQDAAASARTAVRLQPGHGFAHCTLGYVLFHLGQVDAAQAGFRRAIQLQPENTEWRAFLGQALLLDGQLEEGWREFEWRWQTQGGLRLRALREAPVWRGEAIEDRTILLYADQGHSDTLQFCRYVPQIAARARKTIVAVQPSLVRLLSRLPGVTDIVTDGEQAASFDLWCALMSLPHAVGTTLQSIPATTPYLAAEPADIARWRQRLAGIDGLRVGLCWAGGQFNVGQIGRDRRRSLALEMLAPLAAVSGVQFISLQKGPPAADAAQPPPGMTLHDFTADLHDFAETAALMEHLDLVISVDTAVVHLAGALGRPVWLLNKFDTCWRWLQQRDDSPWYPSLRQFRQPAPGDWHSVLEHARDALQRFAAGDRSQLRPRTPGG